jgi:hypothetical protein
MNQSMLEVQKIVGQVSALAIMDDAFRSRLATEPVSVLREHGLDLPAEMPDSKVVIVSSFDEIPADAIQGDTLYLVVPDADELSHEELQLVSGGAASCQSTASTMCGIPSCLSSATCASTNSCT